MRLKAYYVVLGRAQLGDKRALSDLLKLAAEGHAGAQSELGIMYSEGKGVETDQRTAVYWFGRAAEGGLAYGACNLGLHYARGWGVRKDYTLMVKWTFIGGALDGLRCQPGEYAKFFKAGDCHIEKGRELAVAWLKARPDLKNNFGERPWMESAAAYAVTVRGHDRSTSPPPNKRKRKCI